MTVQELISQGYGGYQGWSDQDAAENFRATGGAGKYTGTTSITGAGSDLFGQFSGEIGKRIDEYIDGLMAEAQGDLKFLIKKLDAQHELALGQDNAAVAEFLEKVANKLEEKVGRIPYDYEKYTTRELEDYAKGTERLESSTDRALKRLEEDESYLRGGLDVDSLRARRAQESQLNARGILSSPRDKAEGLAGRAVGKLETDIDRRYKALESSIGRQKEDVSTARQQGLEDLLTTKDRNLVDLTDQARREAINQQMETKFGKEGAESEYERRKKELEALRQTMQLPGLTGSWTETYG